MKVRKKSFFFLKKPKSWWKDANMIQTFGGILNHWTVSSSDHCFLLAVQIVKKSSKCIDRLSSLILNNAFILKRNFFQFMIKQCMEKFMTKGSKKIREWLCSNKNLKYSMLPIFPLPLFAGGRGLTNFWKNGALRESVISLCWKSDDKKLWESFPGGMGGRCIENIWADWEMHFPVYTLNTINLEIFPRHGRVFSFKRKFTKYSGEKAFWR